MKTTTTSSPIIRTIIIGAIVVAAVFLIGLGSVVALSHFGPATAARDVGVIFASTIAAVGVVTTAFVAFQASHHLEIQKDRHERERKVDEERTVAEAALVTLHVIATRLDGYYTRVRDGAESLRNAVDEHDFDRYVSSAKALPYITVPFPLIGHLDTRFMRLAEQQTVRNIEVDVHLISEALERIRSTVKGDLGNERALLATMGAESYFGALSQYVSQLEQQVRQLFKTITPYINQRRSGAVPDEAKLQMLLGILDANDRVAVTSLAEASERVRVVTAQLLREHVHARDLRSLLKATLDGIHDEDSIPVRLTPNQPVI